MRYADVREDIQSGDLILFHGRGFVAWIIRLFTNSNFSHSAIAWRMGGRVLLIESRANTDGVAIGRSLSQALEDGAYWAPMNISWTEPVLKAALDDGIHQKYDFVDAIRAGLGLHPTSEGLQCSEFVVNVFRAAGHGADRLIAPTPQVLANLYGPMEKLEP